MLQRDRQVGVFIIMHNNFSGIKKQNFSPLCSIDEKKVKEKEITETGVDF
jgi:hypothetical protein